MALAVAVRKPRNLLQQPHKLLLGKCCLVREAPLDDFLCVLVGQQVFVRFIDVLNVLTVKSAYLEDSPHVANGDFAWLHLAKLLEQADQVELA